MQTDDLIAALSDGLEPAPAISAGRVMAGGAVLGIVLAALFWLGLFGPRPDLASAIRAWPFWMKFFYTLALAAAAFPLAACAGRPGADMRRPARLLVLPVAVVAVLATMALAAPGAQMHPLIMGHSALFCPFAILIVSLPVLGGTFWSLRRLAPTRLALAGAAAGLFAGAAGALVYSFYCTESAAPFVAIWYTLGVALAAGLGALLGNRALRW